ncbi:tyrosine-protein phosphatase [Demequina sp.]|uniref:tyrosine-protein phosphatase n=1 Tax=Demequina sp. TaxID=2050685 RepID=UPI003A8771B6
MDKPLDRLANIRDLADAAPGLRAGVAYRSDAPLAGDAVPTGLEVWPPRTVLDLRGRGEKHPEHPLGGDATVIDIDILAAANLVGEAARTTLSSLAELYSMMIGPQTAPGLVRVVREVATDDGPVLFHCSAGKDRTGVSAALMLRLLDVDRDRVVADYARTQANMPGVIGRMLGGMPDKVADTPLAAVPREVLEAPAEAIQAVLDVWDEHDGGVEGWYLANGGDRETLDALRARLLA